MNISDMFLGLEAINSPTADVVEIHIPAQTLRVTSACLRVLLHKGRPASALLYEALYQSAYAAIIVALADAKGNAE